MKIAQGEVRRADETLGKGIHKSVQSRRDGAKTNSTRCDRMRANMAHTYSSLLFHCVFSTKERRKIIPEEPQERLWAYMGGIAREHEMKALAIGGTDDHAHILLSLPSSKAIATAMREIKAGSSRWMHESCKLPDFEWQEGYGAFSVGQTQIEATVAYIAR
jgi:putative transposase